MREKVDKQLADEVSVLIQNFMCHAEDVNLGTIAGTPLRILHLYKAMVNYSKFISRFDLIKKANGTLL